MNVSNQLLQKSTGYLEKLCREIPERCTGSEGNRQATDFFEREISALGWDTDAPGFEAMDWHDGGAVLESGSTNFKVFVSPYSRGCELTEELVAVSSIETLKRVDMKGEILLLHGEIAQEQLMPKNFVFYNPEKHRTIISLLEQKQPGAIVCATGRNAALAGGVYPFPLIEDGDFDIPSVFMTEEEGKRLLPLRGKPVTLASVSKRNPGTGCNVIGRRGKDRSERIVVTAHIDAKKGSPGAIDNATGVAVLLLLAELLKTQEGNRVIEIVALNGEDHYAAPGQMAYIRQNRDHFGEIVLNINIDGAGYQHGVTAFSFFGLPEMIKKAADEVVAENPNIVEGTPWPQGDHSMFIQNGCPAIAVTSKWFLDNLENQSITHTPKDDIGIVDRHRLVEIAEALASLVRKIDRFPPLTV